jgi:DNA-binding XRE family transcriptional regulator
MLENPTQIEQKAWRLLSGPDLRAQRIHLGMSQAELATIFGVQRTTLIEVEQKSCDTLSVLWRLAIRTLLREPETLISSHRLRAALQPKEAGQ